MKQAASTHRRPARRIKCRVARPKKPMSLLAAQWLKSLENSHKPSTISAYRTILDAHIIPYFGQMRTDEITEEIIERFFITKCKELSAATASNIATVLRAVLRWGGADISFGRVMPKSGEGREARTLDRSARGRLEAYLIYNVKNGDAECAALLMCLYTGLRLGELCALRWEDISIEEGTLSVRRTVQRISTERGTEVIFGSPKSRDSRRVIPLPSFIIDILAPFRQRGDFYVLTGTEKCMEPRTMQNHFKRHLKNCGLPEINFHALRHTFATGCVEAGFDAKTLCSILGHADVSTTLNTYVHPSMAAKRRLMDGLSQMAPFAKGVQEGCLPVMLG